MFEYQWDLNERDIPFENWHGSEYIIMRKFTTFSYIVWGARGSVVG
jgi:hypothetical protein